MRYNSTKLIMYVIILIILVLSLFLFATRFGHNNIANEKLINFDDIHTKAYNYLIEDMPDTIDSIRLFEPLKDTYIYLKESYIGNGYYTLHIDENYNLAAISVAFPFISNDKIISIYEVNCDNQGNTKSSSYYNDNTFYEKYKYVDGVFIVKGIYGSYILTRDDNLIQTSHMNHINENDKIDEMIFNNKFILDNYKIDSYNISIKKTTDSNIIGSNGSIYDFKLTSIRIQ